MTLLNKIVKSKTNLTLKLPNLITLIKNTCKILTIFNNKMLILVNNCTFLRMKCSKLITHLFNWSRLLLEINNSRIVLSSRYCRMLIMNNWRVIWSKLIILIKSWQRKMQICCSKVVMFANWKNLLVESNCSEVKFRN